MSYTNDSIDRPKQALMMLCTRLVYGVRSSENEIY